MARHSALTVFRTDGARGAARALAGYPQEVGKKREKTTRKGRNSKKETSWGNQTGKSRIMGGAERPGPHPDALISLQISRFDAGADISPTLIRPSQIG